MTSRRGRAAVTALLLPLALVACHSRKSEAPEDHPIAPGIYSNVAADAGGDLTGQEVRLAGGSASAAVDYTLCGEGRCSAARSYPVQRGRGGISFVLPADEGKRSAVVALTPVPDGVMLTALPDGSDAPAESVLLRPRTDALGLAAAR